MNTNGQWVQDADVSGSLMIRPVFGKGDIVTGVEGEETEFTVFPNPTAGEFYIRGKFVSLQILNITGQSVPFEIQESGADHHVLMQTQLPVFIF